MIRFIDKGVLLLVSITLYILSTQHQYLIVPILIATSLSAALSYFDSEELSIWAYIIFLAACLVQPRFLFFLPLVSYDIVSKRSPGLVLLSAPPIFADLLQGGLDISWHILTLLAFSYVLKHRTLTLAELETAHRKLRDNTKEISMQLEKQNEELLEKNDYEINLATLTERNRIARYIHDNVGHLLSRSILQVGALQAVNRDLKTKEELQLIKTTLSEAMDSIRRNVHNLHEESINLKTEIQRLLDRFSFCKTRFDYDIESSPEKNLKNCFISVTKEALSNIIKHSNATEVHIRLSEHPALYQLIIHDNGSNCSYNNENGIGIRNISDRVAAIGGNVNISTEKGFRIFISVQKNSRKGEKNYEGSSNR